MSHYDYEVSKQLEAQDIPFYALIMAAMRRADSTNIAYLRGCWPEVWEELNARYNAPGGVLGRERSAIEYVCPVCEEVFDFYEACRDHIDEVHGGDDEPVTKGTPEGPGADDSVAAPGRGVE